MSSHPSSAQRAGTPHDIRFTRTQDNTVLYSTTLGRQGATANGGTWFQTTKQRRLDSTGGGSCRIVNRGTGAALGGAGDSTVGSSTILGAENGSTAV